MYTFQCFRDDVLGQLQLSSRCPSTPTVTICFTHKYETCANVKVFYYKEMWKKRLTGSARGGNSCERLERTRYLLKEPRNERTFGKKTYVDIVNLIVKRHLTIRVTFRNYRPLKDWLKFIKFKYVSEWFYITYISKSGSDTVRKLRLHRALRRIEIFAAVNLFNPKLPIEQRKVAENNSRSDWYRQLPHRINCCKNSRNFRGKPVSSFDASQEWLFQTPKPAIVRMNYT